MEMSSGEVKGVAEGVESVVDLSVRGASAAARLARGDGARVPSARAACAAACVAAPVFFEGIVRHASESNPCCCCCCCCGGGGGELFFFPTAPR